MNLNWVDWVIIVVGVYYFFRGWEQGLLRLGTSLLSFLLSLWLSIKYHGIVGSFLVSKFGLPALWGTVLGYIVIGFAGEAFIGQLLAILVSMLPPGLVKLKMNNFLGAILSLVNGGAIVAFALLIILALPIKGTAKEDVHNSSIGSKLVFLAEKYGGQLMK